MSRGRAVRITSCSHDGSGVIGCAEGTIGGREFVASWATWEPLAALFYDTWLDATEAQNRAIVAALRCMEACQPAPK